jgi:hypothetical protein
VLVSIGLCLGKSICKCIGKGLGNIICKDVGKGVNRADGKVLV